MSLKNRIHNYLKNYDQWVNGGEIESLAMEAGYKASNASRRLRELETEGLIEKRYNAKGHVEYRFKSESPVNIIWQESERMRQQQYLQSLQPKLL